MSDEARITDCWFQEEVGVIEGQPSGRREVWAQMGEEDDDGNYEEVKLFSYYVDELSFLRSEFIGKTVAEARQLFFRRDMEYLKS